MIRRLLARLDRAANARFAELLTDDGLEERLRHALREEAERVVRDHCEPIPCDIEDNYICAAHRNG